VDAVHALAAGRPVRLRNPNALRPWNHVIQALSGYLHLATVMLESPDYSLASGWNFGPCPGNELPVWELVEMLISHWGSGAWVDDSQHNQLHESQVLRLAIDKALWKLRWKPRWNTEQALHETVQWYQAYFSGCANLGDICRQQIERYESAPGINSASAVTHTLLA
jgi:CDP-glucose 4,6-dehydratase